jgi:O-antigen/teichoic acid export membrane protein
LRIRQHVTFDDGTSLDRLPDCVASDTTPSSGPPRTPLPEGTLPVGLALLIAGVASFAFLRLGELAIGADAFGPVTALWFATFALAPGFFLPLEQELGRALSHRRAVGDGGQPVVRKVRLLGVALGLTVAVVIAIASPWITEHYFDGEWWMLIALLVAFASYAPTHLVRGVCGGMGRFQSYALVMAADGVMRIILCLALWGAGVTSVGAYGMAVAVAPLPGVAWVVLRKGAHTEPGPEADWDEVTPNLGWLLVGSVFAAGLVNAGPVAMNLLRDDNQADLVTNFGQGVLTARIPLFLFQAVQAALLPRLSAHAARGEFDQFRDGFRRLAVLVVAVGIIGTVGAFVLGPWLVDAMFEADLSRATMATLALASALYMMALALAQAVIALKGHRFVAAGWCAGMATFVVSVWLGGDNLFRRIELGLVLSAAAALVVFAAALRIRLASGASPDVGSLHEAMLDMPLES